MSEHLFVIPPTGLLHVIHSENPFERDYIAKALDLPSAELSMVGVRPDGVGELVLVWFNIADGEPNQRAINAVKASTGWDYPLMGPVAIDGLSPETVGDMVAMLS